VLPLGKKANDAYKKLPELDPVGFEENAWQIFDDLNFDRAQIVAEHIMAQFEGGQYDEVKIVYNRFVNAAVQVATVENYLAFGGVGRGYRFYSQIQRYGLHF
jgi:F-type H+-transporting ATPase subunit gamma